MRKFAAFLLIASVLSPGCNPERNQHDNMVPESQPRRLMPTDLDYRGAFRLPRDTLGDTWEWSGTAGGMTYREGGDARGGDDGYPGSLYISGHAWRMQVAEVSIPAPAWTERMDVTRLPRARTLQDFHPVAGRLAAVENLEIMRTGLAFLPSWPGGTAARLYFCWAEHFQEDGPYHGCCSPDLSSPDVFGPWRVGSLRVYSVNDYLFRIPRGWAGENAPGYFLATGRFRDGGWSGQGPALIAMGPGLEGNPPEKGTRLDALPLLLYTSTEDSRTSQYVMDGYHHSDEWTGGVWVDSARFRAVIFVGTKGRGNCWYGDKEGPCLECRGERGWWSDGFEGGFLFYDPDDFAAVARGEAAPHDPQPYAFMVVDSRLFHIESEQEWHHLGPCAWDGERRILYVLEPWADGNRGVIHVWRIKNED